MKTEVDYYPEKKNNNRSIPIELIDEILLHMMYNGILNYLHKLAIQLRNVDTCFQLTHVDGTAIILTDSLYNNRSLGTLELR